MTLEDLIIQLLARMGVSETQVRMNLAAPTDVVRGIVRDQRRNPQERAGAIPDKPPMAGPTVVSAKGNGWRDQTPIEMPGGATTQSLIEEMCDSALPHGRKAAK